MAAAPSGAVIFLHGSGDSGEGVRGWLAEVSGGAFERRLGEAGIKAVYPDAPTIPYTLNGGFPQAVWFDRVRMAYDAPEDKDGLGRTIDQVDSEIDRLVAAGVPVNRIAVAGMSMGACLALHVVFGSGRHAGKLACAGSLSTFLADDSSVDRAAAERFKAPDAAPSPPVFMAHGTADRMINPAWAEATRERLLEAGVRAPDSISMYPVGHELCGPEVEALTAFLLEHLSA